MVERVPATRLLEITLLQLVQKVLNLFDVLAIA